MENCQYEWGYIGEPIHGCSLYLNHQEQHECAAWNCNARADTAYDLLTNEMMRNMGAKIEELFLGEPKCRCPEDYQWSDIHERGCPTQGVDDVQKAP